MTSWESLAATKRAQQLSLIPTDLLIDSTTLSADADVTSFPSTSGLLTALEVEITEVESIEYLLEKLRKGEWKAKEVCGAFCRRALIAQQLTNCLTEVFVDQAMKRAEELDEIWAKSGPVGPLHGLPISLKDQIAVKGVELTMGYIGWLGNISEENSVLVDILLKQGAIVYVRTNVPQSLMSSETENNLFGKTSNPFNRTLTTGGSSGGEGALIAMRGSLLGVGSDIGGSIRIPAGYQGLYALRPSYSRIPYAGNRNSMEGQDSHPSVLGPLSSSIDGLRLFVQSIASAQPWLYDPITLRLPWNESEYHLASHGGEGGKLCFGIQWHDGVSSPQAPYLRALRKTKEALEKAGHEVVEYEPFGVEEGGQLLINVFTADGGVDIQTSRGLSGEPLGCNSVLPDSSKHLSVYEYWQTCNEKNQFLTRLLAHRRATSAITSTGRPIDAIITPVMGTCASKHRGWQHPYTMLFSLADWTTAVFPVLRVNHSIDKQIEKPEKFLSEADRLTYESYDPDLYKGTPIGLQCVGLKNEEEAVIRMTEIIDAALKA